MHTLAAACVTQQGRVPEGTSDGKPSHFPLSACTVQTVNYFAICCIEQAVSKSQNLSAARPKGNMVLKASTILGSLMDGESALRQGQYGAIMALEAYYTVHRKPAAIELPTGYGKTTFAAYYAALILAKNKAEEESVSPIVVYVAPTGVIRDQAEQKFNEVLKAVSDDAAPRIFGAESSADLRAEITANGWPSVLVATDRLLNSPNFPKEQLPPVGLLILDEAHHAAAPTWRTLIKNLRAANVNCKVVGMTATPYRNDRKNLEMELVYSYTIQQAIRDKAFAELALEKVESDQGKEDETMALRALELASAGEVANSGPILCVRANSIEEAERLKKLYETLITSLPGETSGWKVESINNDKTKKQNRMALGRLKAGESSVVVFVGMLTEGMDFPSLRVLAYHRPHRSFPATTQAFGRIARSRPSPAGPSYVVVPSNRLPQVWQDETSTGILYASLEALGTTLPKLAEEFKTQIGKSIFHESRFFPGGQPSQEQEASDANFTWDKVTPSRVTTVYKVDQDTWKRPFGIGKQRMKNIDREDIVALDVFEDGAALAVVTVGDLNLSWYDATPPGPTWNLTIFYASNGFFFESSTEDIHKLRALRRTALRADLTPMRKVEQNILAKHLQGAEDFVANGSRPLVKSALKAAEYRVFMGRAVQQLVRADSSFYGAGHAVGIGPSTLAHSGENNPGGDKLEVRGVSLKKSKVWSLTRADSLEGFFEWCRGLADRLSEGDENSMQSFGGSRLPTVRLEGQRLLGLTWPLELGLASREYANREGSLPFEDVGLRVVKDRATDGPESNCFSFETFNLKTSHALDGFLYSLTGEVSLNNVNSPSDKGESVEPQLKLNSTLLDGGANKKLTSISLVKALEEKPLLAYFNGGELLIEGPLAYAANNLLSGADLSALLVTPGSWPSITATLTEKPAGTPGADGKPRYPTVRNNKTQLRKVKKNEPESLFGFFYKSLVYRNDLIRDRGKLCWLYCDDSSAELSDFILLFRKQINGSTQRELTLVLAHCKAGKASGGVTPLSELSRQILVTSRFLIAESTPVHQMVAERLKDNPQSILYSEPDSSSPNKEFEFATIKDAKVEIWGVVHGFNAAAPTNNALALLGSIKTSVEALGADFRLVASGS